jgi:RecA-family ATPase
VTPPVEAVRGNAVALRAVDDARAPAHSAAQQQGEAAASSPIDAGWGALDPRFLFERPAARRWLLRHPSAAGEGDGFLPAGKVGLLVSAGGVGKTHALVSLAVCVATGREWLGHFRVESSGGRILLGLAEEDADEIHRRLYDAAELYELSPDERRQVVDHVVALPLAGQRVALLDADRNETPTYHALRRRLAEDGGSDGFALVVLDPLARWSGPDTEGDNAAATRMLEVVETLTASQGTPSVLVAHHSSKLARRGDGVDARGVTGLTDGARWVATLRNDGPNVLLGLAKSNYSRPMAEDLLLVRERGGTLRVARPDELAARETAARQRQVDKAEAKGLLEEQRIATAMAGILEALPSARGPVTSREGLCALIKGDKNIKGTAVTRLLASGRLQKGASGYEVVGE